MLWAPTVVDGDARLAIATVVERRLSVTLGPYTARNAVKTFARKLGRAPEELAREDLGPLLDCLRPALNTLLGARRAQGIIEIIEREVEES